MQKLIKGLHKFHNEVYNSNIDFFKNLASGQSPEVLFITCSDSRINPNLITQTEPGDLFVIRNAGNIVPPYGASMNGGETATIEFAIAGLGIKDVIICGHSHCGAMKGLLNPQMIADLPAMKEWLKNAEATKRIMFEHYKELKDDALVTATVEENVLMQLENLKTHPVIASRLSRDQLRLHAWVYKMETGMVFKYDENSGQFVPLLEQPIPANKSTKNSI
jgi:carbonic anhydrase